MQTTDSVGSDPNKVQQHILDVSLLTMTNASYFSAVDKWCDAKRERVTRWVRLARAGHQVVQFKDVKANMLVSVAVDGKVIRGYAVRLVCLFSLSPRTSRSISHSPTAVFKTKCIAMSSAVSRFHVRRLFGRAEPSRQRERNSTSRLLIRYSSTLEASPNSTVSRGSNFMWLLL